jgi:hypothetical protein
MSLESWAISRIGWIWDLQAAGFGLERISEDALAS